MRNLGFAYLPLVLSVGIASLPLGLQAQSSQEQVGAQTGASHQEMGGAAGSKPDQVGSKTGAKGASGMTAADKKFIREAAQGGLAEVELGKLATEKATNADVKKFGQRMIDDHTKAGDELKEVAGEKGIQLPADVSAKDKMTKARLEKMSGGQFDKAYMADMVKDHTKDVSDFRRESRTGGDAEVKGFATKVLPTLEDHLRQAKTLAPAEKTKTMSSNRMGSQK